MKLEYQSKHNEKDLEIDPQTRSQASNELSQNKAVAKEGSIFTVFYKHSLSNCKQKITAHQITCLCF